MEQAGGGALLKKLLQLQYRPLTFDMFISK